MAKTVSEEVLKHFALTLTDDVKINIQGHIGEGGDAQIDGSFQQALLKNVAFPFHDFNIDAGISL